MVNSFRKFRWIKINAIILSNTFYTGHVLHATLRVYTSDMNKSNVNKTCVSTEMSENHVCISFIT